MPTGRLGKLAGAVALAVALAACGGGGDGGWSEEARRGYLESCRAELGDAALCECSLEALEEAIAPGQLQSVDEDRLEAVVVDRCVDELTEFEVEEG